ncbi:MAG TPA: tetratricopeptide repeat protein [Kofleriaceae bacterium]
MQRQCHHRSIACSALAALTLALAPIAAHADIARTGAEPWYQQSTPDARREAQALFAQAVDKHQQLLRGNARDLYDRALKLWDNPDIQWNLSLVLEDLGQYLPAYQQLDSALRWGEALGAERLRQVRARMQALETHRLARIEASSDEPGAEIMLDGQPWFRGAGRQSQLVEPGAHYVASRKTGFFPVTRPISVTAGQAARVVLSMDADRVIETRRWPAWKPWVVVSAGVLIASVGAGLERQALVHRDAATKSLAGPCDRPAGCMPMAFPTSYDRIVTDSRLAAGAFLAGGTAVAVGLTLAWLNQLHVHRTEARAPGPIEVTPILSTGQVGVSAQLRF